MLKNQFVLIEWLDSKGITSEWEFVNEIKPMKPCKCKSIGFLLEDKKDYKTIAQSVSNSQVLGRLSIPTCSIQKITQLN